MWDREVDGVRRLPIYCWLVLSAYPRSRLRICVVFTHGKYPRALLLHAAAAML